MSASDPSEYNLAYQHDEHGLELELDDDDVSREAIYDACYGMVDRCYVFMSLRDDGKIAVRLECKADAVGVDDRDALATDFGERLMHAALHHRIHRSTGALRDETISRALHGRHRDATIAELLAQLDDEELDDDLDVSVPWEKPKAGEETKDG